MSTTLEAPANDSLSQTLAKFKPEDLLNVLSGLKKVVDQDPQQAQGMLEANQDLAYSVLQAEILMGLINDSVISEQIEKFKAQAQANSDEQTTQQEAQQTAQQTAQQAAPQAAPAAPSAAPSQPVDKFAGMGPEQRAFIMQLLAITDEQLALLPPEQQEQVKALKMQYQ